MAVVSVSLGKSQKMLTVRRFLRMQGVVIVTVQTALLENRLLTGSPDLYAGFAQSLKAGLNPQAFFKAKRLEQEERHLRYQETPYSLEPNCKEAPGGLRDLQFIFWIAKAAGLGTTWSDLANHSLLTPDEKDAISHRGNALAQMERQLPEFLEKA